MQKINFSDLYRLPWSKFDNPTGWIEPTTYCQLACPGCYRGLDKINPKRIHFDLKKQKEQIDKLVKIRKIQTVAIAGGEPLLYPKLDDLIAHARKKGLGVRLVSNGCALTEEKLKKLKKLGVTEIVLHLAPYQGRTKDETTLFKLREYYCRMFRKVKGVNLIFVSMVTRQNFSSLDRLLVFYKQNADIITLFILTTYQDIFPKHEFYQNRYVSAEKIRNKVQKNYGVSPCAYLPRTSTLEDYSWLYHAAILHNNEVLGGLSGNAAQKIYEDYQLKTKTPFHKNGPKLRPGTLINLLKDNSARKIALKYFKKITLNPQLVSKSVNAQLILIINSPKYSAKSGWDFCEGCPDAMLYKGKLVRSCMLELIKDEKFTSPGMYL